MILGPLPKMAAPSPVMTPGAPGAPAPAPPGPGSLTTPEDVAQLRSELIRMQMMLAEKTSKERELSMRLASSEKLKTQYAQMAAAMFTENATLRVEQKKMVSEAESRAKDAASQASQASASSAKSNKAVADLTKKVNEQTEELEKVRAAEKDARDQLAKKSSELDIAQKEAQLSKKQMEDLQRVLTETQMKVVELQAKQDLAERAQKDAGGNTEKATAELRSKVTALETKVANLEKENAISERAKADAERAKMDAERAKMDAERAKMDAERGKADAEHAKADAEHAKAEAEHTIEVLRAQIDMMKSAPKVEDAQADPKEIENLKTQLSEAQARASDMEAKAIKAKTALETFSVKFKELRAQLDEETAKNSKMMIIIPALKQQLDVQKKRAEDAEQTNADISAKVERLVSLVKARRQQEQQQQLLGQDVLPAQYSSPPLSPTTAAVVEAAADPNDPFSKMLAEQEKDLHSFEERNKEYLAQQQKHEEASLSTPTSPSPQPSQGSNPLDALARQLNTAPVFTNF